MNGPLVHPYQCDNCEKKFTIIFDLNQHNSLIHSIFEKKQLKCDFCDTTFTLNSQLKYHIGTVHERKKPFQCNDCNKSFGRKTYLR